MPRVQNKEKQAEWYRKNRERLIASARKHYAANKEKAAKQGRKWASQNPTVVAAIKKKYVNRNRARIYANNATWRKANPELIRAYGRVYMSRRRARRRNQIHPKHNRKLEMMMAKSCAELTRTMGVQHHVDHIIPLVAGGWHHHDNLQIVPAKLNQQKHADPFREIPGYKSWRDVPRSLWPDHLVMAFEVRLLFAHTDDSR